METLLSKKSRSNGKVPHSKNYGWASTDFDNSLNDYTPRQLDALDGVKFIADHLHDEHEEKQVRETVICKA